MHDRVRHNLAGMIYRNCMCSLAFPFLDVREQCTNYSTKLLLPTALKKV